MKVHDRQVLVCLHFSQQHVVPQKAQVVGLKVRSKVPCARHRATSTDGSHRSQGICRIRPDHSLATMKKFCKLQRLDDGAVLGPVDVLLARNNAPGNDMPTRWWHSSFLPQSYGASKVHRSFSNVHDNCPGSVSGSWDRRIVTCTISKEVQRRHLQRQQVHRFWRCNQPATPPIQAQEIL